MCKAFLREKNEFLFRTSLPLPPSLGAWKIKVPPPKGGGVGWLRTASRLVKAQPATVKGIVWFKAAVSLGFVRTEVVCVFNLSFWSTVDLQRCINFCCSVPFSSVTQSCLTLCDPVDCSTPGLPVHHQLPGFTQTVHWVGDAIHFSAVSIFLLYSKVIQLWELDYKESWAPKNWCFWTVVLEKTLESPLDCKEIQPVHPKGNQFWVFIGRTDAEAETPILWLPDAKSWLIWKDSDAGKDWGQEEKEMTEDEMAGWHHRLDGHKFE